MWFHPICDQENKKIIVVITKKEKRLGFQYQVISYKDWDELKDDNAKKAFINNLMPRQLNVNASIFRPRKYLDPNTRPFKAIHKI